MAPLLGAPPESPHVGDIRGGFAVYCTATCDAGMLQPFETVERLPDQADHLVVEVALWGTDFGIPNAETLAAWGSGDTRGIENAQQVMVVQWAAPLTAGMSAAVQIGRALEAGPWIEDLETGRVYDAPTFTVAVDGLANDKSDITSFISVESSAEAGRSRLVTRGLSKTGQANLVMTDVAPESEAEQAEVLRVTAQTLHERPLPGASGVVELDSSTLGTAVSPCKITGVATLAPVKRHGDDPQGALVGVHFDGTVDACTSANEVAPSAELATTPPSNQATLDAARTSALERLGGTVRAAFLAGLGPDESLMVKAPFKGGNGSTEWLWFHVESWNGPLMVGTLQSPPMALPGLTVGAKVAARDDQVFDYLWFKSDGTQEGNTTQPFLEAAPLQ